MQKNFKQLLSGITAFVFDVDGVLTDGSLIIMPTGDQVRTMNIKDGYAMQLAIKNGYKVAIISGGNSESVRKRLTTLGIQDVYLGIKDKVEAFDEFLSAHDLKPGHVLYMGDDMPDYEVMKKAGVAVCPKDAVSDIRSICLYVSDKAGGEGCVRDVIEQVLRVQEKW